MQEELERLRQSYRAFLAKYRNDLRDPFASKSVASAARSGESNLALANQTAPASANYSAIKPSSAAGGASAAPASASLFSASVFAPPALSGQTPAPQFSFGNASAGVFGGNPGKRLSVPFAQPNQTPNPFLQTPRQ